MRTQEEREAAFHALQRAAEGLIAPGAERGERSTTQWLALQLIGWIGVMFALDETPDADNLVRLRGAMDGLMPEKGIKWRRAQCVRDIAKAGSRWKALPANDTTERERLLVDLAMALSAWSGSEEGAFDALCDGTNAVPMTADLRWLSSRLDAFDPKPAGRQGAKSAERILAEIIVEELDANGALGLAPTTEESSEDATERIRKLLARDVARFNEDVRLAEEKTL